MNFTNDDDHVRSTVYQWYDGADRLTAIANYGSGDTTAGAGTWKYVSTIPTRGSTPPDWNQADVYDGKVLLTKFTYNADSSLQEKVVVGVKKNGSNTDTQTTTTSYDRLGRRIKVEEADTATEERHTVWGYNGLGQVRQLIADVNKNASRSGDGWTADAGDQDTIYFFEDSVDASRVTNEIYPDSSDTGTGGTDQIKLTYNIDGTLKQRTDQRGTVIDFAYNGRRQNEAQTVSTLGGATDGAVRAITRTYDSLGRPDKITSHGNVTSDPLNTANITSQVVYAYNSGISKVSQVWQSHEGAAVTSGMGQSPYLLYLYDETATTGVYTNGLRLKDVYPPSNNFITYDYGASGSIDDKLHRVQNLKIKWPDATTKTVVTYAYNGTGRLAKVQYGDAGLRLNYWGSSETDDNYQHYDRFGRIRTQKWEDYTPTVTVVDQFDYTHDYAGNRLTRDIPASLYATNDKDQVYTYDLLFRLKTFDEGTLVGTSISGTPKKEEDWTLDALGNWTGLIKKTNGTTDLNQTRAHNDANEVGTISATVGINWADPTHDNAGNTTRIPQPTSLAKAYDLTYDAWNRLVKVVDNDTALTVATFEYDGRNYRIIKVDVAADPDKTYHYYYNESWQCLEMRLDASTSPKEQYFWGTHYIDALAVRYWDSNGDTDFLDTDEVQYYSHDANFNVTGVYTTAGVAAERYRYTPYGDLLVLDANFANDADGLSDFANATTFTGRLLDTEYGQYYFRNRYFGPGLGRFGARDPIGYRGNDRNLYNYVTNRPTQMKDPLGLLPNQDEACDYTDVIDYVIERQEQGASPSEILYGIRTELALEQGKRYVYTTRYGWIDLRHFSASTVLGHGFGYNIAVMIGYGVEMRQELGGGPSGFGEEDLPSNSAGADFGASQFDPNGDLANDLEDWFIENGALNICLAPGFLELPPKPVPPGGSNSDSGIGSNQSDPIGSDSNSTPPPRKGPPAPIVVRELWPTGISPFILTR